MYKTSVFRPNCVNYGCGKPVTFSSTDQNGNKRWRVHCAHCQKASYGGHPHAPGVTPFKTGTCSNKDSKLGFPCVIDWNLAAEQNLSIATEIDHINGDHVDNKHENLQELCPVCHKIKGSREGNFDGFRNLRGPRPRSKATTLLSTSLFFYTD
jgi:5-methylcytosine-specific restriction endonuclease McrA